MAGSEEHYEFVKFGGYQAGQRFFNHYTLRLLIGQGRTGMVWLAEDERTGKTRALKFLPEILRFDKVALNELRRETRKAMNLRHPNIVRLYDFLVDDAAAAVVLEYVSGETLKQRIIDAPSRLLPLADVRPLVGQLCAALGHSHEGAGLIHRDLRPSNLILNETGRLKISDFAIGDSIQESLTRISQSENSLNPVAYMSPQQAMGKKPRPSDDIYSAGIVLFEMVTGRAPFKGRDALMHILEQPAPSAAEVRNEVDPEARPLPSGWDAVIAKCLSKEPADRPQSAAALSQALGLGGVYASIQDTGEIEAVRSGAPRLDHATMHNTQEVQLEEKREKKAMKKPSYVPLMAVGGCVMIALGAVVVLFLVFLLVLLIA